RVEREHGNVRAALRWAVDAGRAGDLQAAEQALRLAGSLWTFWFMRKYMNDGRMWLREALSAGESASGPVRAKALVGAGMLAVDQGDVHGLQDIEAGLALYRAAGDAWGTAYAQMFLGHCLATVGEH